MKNRAMIMYDILMKLVKGDKISRQKNGRCHTPNQLAESGLAIIDSHHDKEVDVIVYEDGSVVYKQHYSGQCPHTTVFDIRRAAYYKRGDDEYCFEHEDSFLAISIYADQRIIYQNDARWVDNISTVVADEELDVLESKSNKGSTKNSAEKETVVRKRNLPPRYGVGVSILDDILRKEEFERLYEAMQQLTPAQREFVALYFGEDLSEPKIAELLNISRNSVMDRHIYSIKKLKKILKNYYS